jgi:hypothetical protein
MDEPVNVILKDLGVVNGIVTVEVINADTGEVIGYNQTWQDEEE